MSGLKVTWVLKTANGGFKGPFTTESILKKIENGELQGNELISKYPDGKWVQISKREEFYDKLLESFENPNQRKKTPIISEENQDNEATVIITEEEVKNQESMTASRATTLEVVSPRPPLKPAGPFANQSSGPTHQNQNAHVIELNDLKAEEKKKVKEKIFIPLVLGLAAIAIIFYFLFEDTEDSHGDYIQLIYPGKQNKQLTQDEVISGIKSALKAIVRDNVESYIEAEQKLVEVIEGAPKSIEARGHLCLVYKELWPFTKQDVTEQKKVNLLVQTTRGLDLINPYGYYCEAVKLFTMGKYKEARAVIDKSIDNTFYLSWALHQMKGELLEVEKDLSNAISYYETASNSMEYWLKPKVSLGLAYAKKNETASAARYFNMVLEKNPKHKVARIGLGILEYKYFNKIDNALSNLRIAVESKLRAPKNIESSAYEILADIMILKNNKKEALVFAKNAYRLNPRSEKAKELIIRMGGRTEDVELSSEDSQLCATGDQFYRQGDFLASQAEYKSCYQLNPKNSMAAYKAAKSLWEINQSYDALEWLKKAIKADPNNVSAYVLLSDYQSQRYDFNGAVQTIATANQISRNSYEVMRAMSLLELRKGNALSSINYGLRALKLYDGDIETYIILSNANHSLALSIIPSSKQESDKKQTAIRDALKYASAAIEIDSTNVNAQNNYVKMLALMNGIDSGISYANELINKFSFNYEYRLGMADLLKSEERFGDALKYYQQVAEFDQKNKKAFLGMGQCLKMLGQMDKALKVFLDAALIDPTDGEALMEAGKIYLETNRFDSAIRQFERVKRINQFFPRTNLYIAKASKEFGKYDEAIKFVNEEKKLNPSLVENYTLLGEIYHIKKQYSECAAEYSSAIKIAPQGADVYVKASRCYRLASSIDIAESMLALAQRSESGYAEIYREQGAIFETRGQYREAAVAYDKYLNLAPNAPDKAEIEARISNLGSK